MLDTDVTVVPFNPLGVHTRINEFVTGDNHWVGWCDEFVVNRNVFPCVNEDAISIEDLDVLRVFGQPKSFALLEFLHAADIVFCFVHSFVCCVLHFDCGSIRTICEVDTQQANRRTPININAGSCILPSERFSVFEFEIPLVGIDLNLKGVFGVRIPHSSVGTKRKNGEPNNKNSWEDVKHRFQFCIVPIDRESPHFNVINSGCVRFNTISIAQHCCKQPTECKNCYKNRPEHVFVVKDVENGIFRWHGCTLFKGARRPTLSVGVKQALK